MMAVTDTSQSKGIHHDILEWSTELPSWQRDALRRIIENGSLNDDDIDELTIACRHANGLDEENLPELSPLASEHLPTKHIDAGKITLCSVSEPENVNALDETQSLTFASSGLTVVFGYNGSGKSGYGRILRRACRARSKGKPILPNAMNTPPETPASAIITYAIDDVDQEPVQWVDDQQSIDQIGSVSFFDADCASVHVREKNGIAFTPFGLDVLPALGTACKAVQSRLDTERKQLEANSPQFLKSSIATGTTKVGLAIKSLKATTSSEELELLASLSDKEQQRLKDISAQLAADPQKMAKELRTRAGRIENLRKTIEAASKALSDSGIDAIKVLAQNLAMKTTAAQVAAKTNFADEPLSHIGEEVWRQLWEAARKYSEISFPDDDFPVTNQEDAVCVLCQQPLEEDAKSRLSRFEQFVQDDSAQQAAKAKETLDDAVTHLDTLGLLDKALQEQLKDIESPDDKSVVATTRQLIATLIRRLRAVQRAHNTCCWDFSVPGAINTTIDATLASLVTSLKTQATETEKSADLTERKLLEKELEELKAREWLATVLGDVKEYVARLAMIKKLNKAKTSTLTNKITAKSKELAKSYVTDQLRDAFANEVKKMHQGVRRLNVELVATAGEFGSSYYRVQLVGATKEDIGSIVSEDEHRCIALAGFLAELATEPCKSTIVFDDPVTSLDHHWRECFAQRLVTEAADRQVIVFTHDIVFLHDLRAGAKKHNVPIELKRVQSNRDSCGVLNDGLPWIAQKALERIKELKGRIQEAEKLYRAQNDDEYERVIFAIYSDIRATVEKAVEENLFLGIVKRHQDYIPLGNLKKVTALSINDCERIQTLFQRCCDITSAHDRSSLRNFGVPTPDNASDDLSELKSLIEDLRVRQKRIV